MTSHINTWRNTNWENCGSQMGFEPTTLRHLVEEGHGLKSHLGHGFLATDLSGDHLEGIVAVRMPLNRPIIPWVRVSIGLVQFTEHVFKPEVDAFTKRVKRTVDQAVTQAICTSV